MQYLIDAGHRCIRVLAGHKGPTHYHAIGYHNAPTLMIFTKNIHSESQKE
jgi:hypothetical protein